MAGATKNCCHLGAFFVHHAYNHAPCHFMQSHIRKVYACFTGILKGNRTDEASWLENVKTVQLFPPAGSFGSSVILLFLFCCCCCYFFVRNLNASSAAMLVRSLPMKSTKRFACDVFDTFSTHADLVYDIIWHSTKRQSLPSCFRDF